MDAIILIKSNHLVNFNQWHQKEHPNEIAVVTSFMPTVDIKYIDSLSLDELIIQNCFKEKASYTHEDALEFRRELNASHHVTFKFVPDSSNLAKAYCLEDPYHFKLYNSGYCNNVRIKYIEVRRKENEQKPQEVWDKYLE